MRPGPLGRRRAPSSSITSSASTMGSGGIRRLATSVPERSSSGATTKYWQPNPGVYETGASPEDDLAAVVGVRAAGERDQDRARGGQHHTERVPREHDGPARERAVAEPCGV